MCRWRQILESHSKWISSENIQVEKLDWFCCEVIWRIKVQVLSDDRTHRRLFRHKQFASIKSLRLSTSWLFSKLTADSLDINQVSADLRHLRIALCSVISADDDSRTPCSLPANTALLSVLYTVYNTVQYSLFTGDPFKFHGRLRVPPKFQKPTTKIHVFALWPDLDLGYLMSKNLPDDQVKKCLCIKLNFRIFRLFHNRNKLITNDKTRLPQSRMKFYHEPNEPYLM